MTSAYALPINRPRIELATIKAVAASELNAVNELIKQQLFFNTPLISEVCKHLLSNGGKRLRPLLLLLSARLFDYQQQDHLLVATVIEFLHAATLLHDDVIDNSKLRHHRKTANAIWGNTSSVLVGDYLHVLSFQILNQLNNPQVTDIIVAGTRATVEGEVMQLMHRHAPEMTEAQYTAIISNKTAQFFSIAAQLGAVIARRSSQEITAMAAYGMHLGMAYQLMDDAFDYSANAAATGKNIGDDLAEGKTTLPLIYAMQHSNAGETKLIRQAIKEGDSGKLAIILKILHSTQALEYTVEQARQHISKAITCLPNSTHQAYYALKQLAEFVIQ